MCQKDGCTSEEIRGKIESEEVLLVSIVNACQSEECILCLVFKINEFYSAFDRFLPF